MSPRKLTHVLAPVLDLRKVAHFETDQAVALFERKISNVLELHRLVVHDFVLAASLMSQVHVVDLVIRIGRKLSAASAKANRQN